MSINGEKFRHSFDLCMKLEGGGKYHEVEGDSGGATKFGVSLRYLQSIDEDIDGDGDVDWEDVFALTEKDARKIAYEGFWNDHYDRLYKPVAMTLFCTGYNMGQRTGVKLLQRACNNLGGRLAVDGIIGDKTVEETKKHSEKSLVIEYCDVMMDRYIDIVLKNSSQKKFFRGWKNRTFKYLELI